MRREHGGRDGERIRKKMWDIYDVSPVDNHITIGVFLLC